MPGIGCIGCRIVRCSLDRHGIWSQIANGRECVACQTTQRNWFPAVHHRETPERIRNGKSDAVGALQNARHRASADDYLAFPATKVAQDAYAGFGLVRARPEELALKPID